MSIILIIATSGRMLAQIANRLGFKTLVIDLYADKDTEQAALKLWQIQDLGLNHLKPILQVIKQYYTVDYLIYGSGFEQHIDSLFYLETEFNLIGNRAEVFNAVQNKHYFFNTLKQYQIPHPETQFIPPNNQANWLIKPMQGQGGLGIDYYNNQDYKNHYWQYYQQGFNHSVLFLADGETISILGFNTQWTTQSFLFSGIINHCSIPEQNKLDIIVYVKILSKVFKLKGLNSLDFIFYDNKVYVLEINARISASMQLYGDNVLLNHIENTLNIEKQNGFSGYQIIYAKQPVIISEQITWQENCVDLPQNGQICQTGQPICSIIAHHEHAAELRRLLISQQHFLELGFYTHAIPSQR